MQSYSILKKLIDHKLAVVIRGDTIEQAKSTAVACMNGGVKSLEITFTVPKAQQLLESFRDRNESVFIGAGTVLDSETARIAILSGAQFIVSPTFNIETAKLCNRYFIPYIPGCMTINEMMQAVEYGVCVVKLFPGAHFDPSFIKNIKGPLPNIQIMPTGGINLDNIQTWLKAGAALVGVGGEITHPGKDGDFNKVEKLALQFVKKVMEV